MTCVIRERICRRIYYSHLKLRINVYKIQIIAKLLFGVTVIVRSITSLHVLSSHVASLGPLKICPVCQTHQIPHRSLLARAKHISIGLVNDLTGRQESLLALDGDGDKVDEAVVADEAGEGLVEEFVFLGEVVLGEGVQQVLQVQHVGVVIQAELEISILLHKVHLAEYVDMGERDLKHGGERGQADRDELASVGAVVRVHQVDTSQADVTTT